MINDPIIIETNDDKLGNPTHIISFNVEELEFGNDLYYYHSISLEHKDEGGIEITITIKPDYEASGRFNEAYEAGVYD